jgi:hypothetical protein
MAVCERASIVGFRQQDLRRTVIDLMHPVCSGDPGVFLNDELPEQMESDARDQAMASFFELLEIRLHDLIFERNEADDGAEAA